MTASPILNLGILFLFVIFISYMRKYGQHKKIKWIMGCYVIVLLLSLAVFQMINDDNFTENHEIIDQEAIEADNEAPSNSNLYYAAREGRLDQTEGVQVKGQWSFEFTEKQLEVVNVDSIGILLMAEIKDTDDGKIQVVEYTTKSIVAGIDVTNEIKSHQVTLQGNKLLLKKPAENRVELRRFKNDFTVTQFTGDSSMDQQKIYSSSMMGSRILILSIPKNVQLDTSKFHIEFIDKDN